MQQTVMTVDALALVLEQMEQVFLDNTDDWATIHAFNIAIATLNANEMTDDKTVESVIDGMAMVANWFLGQELRDILSPTIRAQLKQIQDTRANWFNEPAEAVT